MIRLKLGPYQNKARRLGCGFKRDPIAPFLVEPCTHRDQSVVERELALDRWRFADDRELALYAVWDHAYQPSFGSDPARSSRSRGSCPYQEMGRPARGS